MSLTGDDENAIFADLAGQLADIELPSDVEDVTKLSSLNLARKFAKIEVRLAELNELYRPHTDEGRELHSRRAAYLYELRKRKLR